MGLGGGVWSVYIVSHVSAVVLARLVYALFLNVCTVCLVLALGARLLPSPSLLPPTSAVVLQGVDWRDGRHWQCNDNVHPSRHGTYDGIGFHPFETIFVKSSWHVADPYTERYAAWRLKHLSGSSGTEGRFNQRMYLYGVRWAARRGGSISAWPCTASGGRHGGAVQSAHVLARCQATRCACAESVGRAVCGGRGGGVRVELVGGGGTR